MSIDNRPMSPHLDVYRWRITMLSSILHRASGSFVSLGLFILVLRVLMIAVNGAENFSEFGFFMNTFWFVWSMAIYYHMCNGIRHLVWDAGHGFEVKTAENSAKIVMVATVVLTVVTWLVVLI
ncbi:MAG: succinate dehydrogenase, cytochrome b556 subunit [Gammaproteobacteria bacterium]|nr:succinate dehydrogenase, cytochrome b556 subunit [Gammaproteobacteria bacterium]